MGRSSDNQPNLEDNSFQLVNFFEDRKSNADFIQRDSNNHLISINPSIER